MRARERERERERKRERERERPCFIPWLTEVTKSIKTSISKTLNRLYAKTFQACTATQRICFGLQAMNFMRKFTHMHVKYL